MRTLLLLTLLYTNTLFANSFEVEAVHLKNGDVVSAQDESFSFEDVRAVEIIDGSNSLIIVSPKVFERLLNGGDAGGGSPIIRINTKAAVRVGGDGSGGG